MKGCPVDQYGPDCSYQCQCASCNRFTGICDCNGTECYEGKCQVLFFKINNQKKISGIYSRSKLQSECSSSASSSSSTTNLVLLIVLPIIGVTILVSTIAVILYWKLVRSKANEIYSPSNEMIDERF